MRSLKGIGMGRRRGKVFGTVIAVISIVAVAAWGQVDPEISLDITDSAGTPLDTVSPDTNDPAIGGSDFLLVLRTSDAADLVTYAQQVFFDARRAKDEATDAEFAENLKVKEALVAKAEALMPIKDVKAVKRALRPIQDAWDEAGRVPRSAVRRIEAPT